MVKWVVLAPPPRVTCQLVGQPVSVVLTLSVGRKA